MRRHNDDDNVNDDDDDDSEMIMTTVARLTPCAESRTSISKVFPDLAFVSVDSFAFRSLGFSLGGGAATGGFKIAFFWAANSSALPKGFNETTQPAHVRIPSSNKALVSRSACLFPSKVSDRLNNEQQQRTLS